jgi:hypothetical protein
MSVPRWRVDGYQEWLDREGVAVTGGLAVDLFDVETALWPRFGVPGAVVLLDARGDYCDLHLIEVPAAGRTEAVRHLYESVTFVLEGAGSTVIELPDGTRHSFEWGKGTAFAVPLNARYRHLNASGGNRALLANVTNLPMVMKLYRNDDFVFDTDAAFPDRIGKDDHFRGTGTFIPIQEHRHIWETNVVPDMFTFAQLRDSPSRGRNSTNIHFVFADGTMHAHVSEIPAGDYKKAHRHEAGYHIFQLGGGGYSLYWFGDEEPRRVDWKWGLVHSPMDGMWHQHFNVNETPARYFAATIGSIRYPYTARKMQGWGPQGEIGEDQIEYVDERPEIRAVFDAERKAAAERQQ